MITLRLNDEDLHLLIEVAEEVTAANIAEIADPDLPEPSRDLLTVRTLRLTALTEQLRQAQQSPYVLRVEALPHPGVLIEVKPFQTDGLFYVDMNTRDAGHSIGTIAQLGPARYRASAGDVVFGDARHTEGAMWLCLRRWITSPQFSRIIARSHVDTAGGEA